MGNTPHFFGCDFSRAYIKTAIDLPRVRRNYLAVKFFGERHAERGFSGSGRSENHNQRHFSYVGRCFCFPEFKFYFHPVRKLNCVSEENKQHHFTNVTTTELKLCG